MLDRVAKGEKINLSWYKMDKMLFTLKQKISSAKKKTIFYQKVIVPYVTIITRIAKYLSSWNSKYDLLSITITYNLGLITKMGYKDVNRKWVKIISVWWEDNDDDAPTDTPTEGQALAPPTQDPVVSGAPSIVQVMEAWGQI